MDYPELIAEVASRVSEPGFAMRGEQLTRQAEAVLSQHFKPFEYQVISPIAENGTNWLLNDNQEIYAAALIQQFYLFKMQAEAAQAAGVYLTSLIERKKSADRITRLNGVKYIAGGHKP